MAARSDRDAEEDQNRSGETCPCFEIRSSPESGLGLYARRDIAEGEVVLEELPFATTVAAEHDASCCVECLWYSGKGWDEEPDPAGQGVSDKQVGEGFAACPGCHVSTFCSSCQPGSGAARANNASTTTTRGSSTSSSRHPAALCCAYKALQSLCLSEEEQDDVRFLLSLLWVRVLRPPLKPSLQSLWHDLCERTVESAGPSDGAPRVCQGQGSRLEGLQSGRGPPKAEARGEEGQGSEAPVGVKRITEALRPSCKRMRSASSELAPEAASEASSEAAPEVVSPGMIPSGAASSGAVSAELAEEWRTRVPNGDGRGTANGIPAVPGTAQGGRPAIDTTGPLVPPSSSADKVTGPIHPSSPLATEVNGSLPPSDLWALVEHLDKDPHLMVMATQKSRCERIHHALVSCTAEGPGARQRRTLCTPGAPRRGPEAASEIEGPGSSDGQPVTHQQCGASHEQKATTPGEPLGRDAGSMGEGGVRWLHLWGTSPVPSLEATAALVSSHDRNTFAIMAPHGSHTEMKVRAFAMYPTASLFNHSCYPNLCRFDYLHGPGDVRNAALQLRAMRRIQRGEQLFISYFPLAWPLPQRQQRLRSEYGFVCACPRCALEEKGGAWEGEEEEEEEEEEGEEGEEGDTEECEEEDEDQEIIQRSVAAEVGDAENKEGGVDGADEQGTVQRAVKDRGEQGKMICTLRGREQQGRVNGAGHNGEEQERREGVSPEGNRDGDEEMEGLSVEDREGPEGVEGALPEDSAEAELAHAMYFRKHLCALEGCRGTVCACQSFTGTARVSSTSGTDGAAKSPSTIGAHVPSTGAVIVTTTEEKKKLASREGGAPRSLESEAGHGGSMLAIEEEVMRTLCDYYECNACGKIWARAEWARHIAESFHD